MTGEHNAASIRAMRISLIVGFAMLIAKLGAWWHTGSAAILSDAAESVIHVFAVAFAAFSLRLSFRPADSRFHYGYERVSFFSAGFEGGMIIVAALLIIVESVERWRAGVFPTNLETGTTVIAVASVVNLLLGAYLLRAGKRARSIILEANGKHVLTDSWTSFGVVGGLLLVIWTGWQPFDPLLAILVAANIVWSGGSLVWRSVRGLMDYADPVTGKKIGSVLDTVRSELGIGYHELRYRSTGTRTIVEVHLLFPYGIQLGRAHEVATAVERRLAAALEGPVSVVTHLEAEEDHEIVHGSERPRLD